MVIVSLSGGLGNQLFQFAAGYALSKKCKSRLFLDASFFSRPHPNMETRHYKYEIDKVLRRGDWRVIHSRWISRVLRSYFIFSDILSIKTFRYLKIQEKNLFETSENAAFRYCPIPRSGNYFLNGYWQNLDYFNDAQHEILDLIIAENKTSSVPTIGLHVRKGDIIGSNVDLCTANYFHAGVARIMTLKGYDKENCKIKIFSEDLPWVGANIILPGYNIEYIIGDPSTTAVDFQRMSICDDIVISNSTFSWWAALKVSQKFGSIVVCPSHWWNNIDSKRINLYPPGWIVMPV